jgi:hypothetical protein
MTQSGHSHGVQTPDRKRGAGSLSESRAPPAAFNESISSRPGQPFDVVDHALSYLEAEGFVRCLPRFVVQQSVPQGASR